MTAHTAKSYVALTIRLTAVVSFLSLCLLVGAVGVIAAIASVQDSWIWLFRMERAANAAGPVAVWLTAISLVTGAASVLTVD